MAQREKGRLQGQSRPDARVQQGVARDQVHQTQAQRCPHHQGQGKEGGGAIGRRKDSDDDYEEDAEDGEGGKDAAAAKKKGPTLPAKSAKGGAAKGGASKGAAKKPAAPRKKK